MMDVENASEFLTPEVVEIVQDKKVDFDTEEEVQEIPNSLTPKTPCTPSNNHHNSNGHTSSSPATPQSASSSKKRKRLTPQEREERERERTEKRLKLEEEKLKRDEEKKKREEERLAKLHQKEQERLKREEEKRKKQEEINKRNKEKEDEKRKKQEEEERKKKEKEQKEEERLKKIEEKEKERLKREQEKQQKIEEKEREKKREEEKKAKQALKFTSFFQKSPGGSKIPAVKRPPASGDVSVVEGDQNDASFVSVGGDDADISILDSSISNPQSNLAFNPMMFQVKSNMALAPLLRRPKLTFDEIQNLDQYGFSSNSKSSTTTTTPTKQIEGTESMEIDLTEDSSEPIVMISKRNGSSSPNYLHELKVNTSKGRYGRGYGRTEMPDNDMEIQVISNKIIENPRAEGLIKWRYKLLQFHDNQRPAYWGTWKKPSVAAKPRKPLGQEKDIDYEFDSDDEWEEEPEDGEDLGSDKESEDPADKEDEEEDDDDGWWVPHGYISDDEGAQDEHLDKEALKIQEKNYFEGLNKQIKVHLPEIQTERLSEFRLVFSPLMKKWKKISAAQQTVNVQPGPSSSVRAEVVC